MDGTTFVIVLFVILFVVGVAGYVSRAQSSLYNLRGSMPGVLLYCLQVLCERENGGGDVGCSSVAA